MSYDTDDTHQGWDEGVTRVLRDLYAAPSDPAYWDSLQQRIMMRIESEGEPWWNTFGQWSRVGAVAAGLFILASGLATTFATRDADAQVVMRKMIDDTPPLTAYDRSVMTAGLSEKEASFQYVISHP
jgi:hypothetical protein